MLPAIHIQYMYVGQRVLGFKEKRYAITAKTICVVINLALAHKQ